MAWMNRLMELGDVGFGSAVSRCSGRRAPGGRRKEKQMARRVRSGRRGVASRRGCDARTSTARGLRDRRPATSGGHAASRLCVGRPRRLNVFLKRCDSDSTNVTVSDTSTRQHC